MTANQLELFGKICQMPVKKTSPSGIPHCQFVIEHRSQQKEAGFQRQVWCRMSVIVSGQPLQALTHSITVGCNIIVRGFISSHKGRDGLSKLVLHAEHIELIDSGD